MRELKVDTSEDPVSLDIIQVLQLRAANDPWLSGLKTFVCVEATEAIVPFIHIFLSPGTTNISITFAKDGSKVVVGSTIARLSTLCPGLKDINLCKLPRDPIITEAVSEMLLACNRDILQAFDVHSPLTEEAREVVYRLPRLSQLWAIIRGPTSLPTVALPNLIAIYVEYDDLNWLQGFHGATLTSLEFITFRSKSEEIGDFLGAFETAALTTSAQNTLSGFKFCTSRPWDLKYSSLLAFRQLKDVEIQFSCEGGCSSRVDDDIILNLARAMPKLETLQLGGKPCATPNGITFNGFIGLARLCPHLSKLCIHFQPTTLVEAATSASALPSSKNEPVIRREDCALTVLEVGNTPLPAQSNMEVALILFQIFPRILNIKYINKEWRAVAQTIQWLRQVATFVHRAGKAWHPTHTQ